MADSQSTTSPNGRVSGKVVFISGAAQGMGASHARVLASEGAQVVIGDLQESTAASLAEEINETEGRVAAASVRLDVTDLE
ncbi:SDR family NAD(P)-dependent oxidoreductase [Brevibacterium sediminis]|uniref:SDR family NAD(P)-dependent oxidoreductase n=1 Tax=Brevibacterium sediminis TaxID=1857024 RepID=UPI003B3A58A5